MQVREIMTENPACCTPDTPLQEVARMMEQNNCGLIPVVNSRSDMKPVGTITDRDITIRTVAASKNPIDMKASEAMTPDVATVKPQMSIEECFDAMEDQEIRRVLVTDEQGRCCGIVAQADIVQSHANPVRTNKVIREISESAPSRTQSSSAGWLGNPFSYRSHGDSDSYMSSNTLLPLLIGLGSGMALMYFINSREDNSYKNYRRGLDSYSFEHENRMNRTNQESFGKYADAEQEIEKRQHNLEDRFNSLRTGSNPTVSNTADSLDRENDSTIDNKGRSAGQGT